VKDGGAMFLDEAEGFISNYVFTFIKTSKTKLWNSNVAHLQDGKLIISKDQVISYILKLAKAKRKSVISLTMTYSKTLTTQKINMFSDGSCLIAFLLII
jgi:hypothetical protein